MSRPLLYLTNAASVAHVRLGRASIETRAAVGPGRHICIMAKPRPRYGEAGVGRVTALAPQREHLEAVKAGRMGMTEYRALFLAGVVAELAPGHLTYAPWNGDPHELVQPGDTLTCSCGRGAARAGRCHRVWAADLLADAGWRVVLDGQVVVTGDGR